MTLPSPHIAWLLVLPMLAAASAVPSSADLLPGPIPAEVLSVYDGDTLTVRARVWLGQTVETRVRLRGVDAPEVSGACAAEKRAAAAARDFLRRHAGSAVMLREVSWDSYPRRVVARVESLAGEDLGRLLMAAGLARPYTYDGRRRPGGWCD